MRGFKITKKEVRSRMGYILLGFFAYYLVEPVRTWADANLHISPWIVGIGGLVAVFYFFEF